MCKLKTVNIKGKEYVEVNERLKAFRTLPEYKGYSLESDIYDYDKEKGIITIKAVIRDSDGVIKATGYAQEKESSSFINKTSFVENCETSAWGRALGNLGIGIDTSVASAEEVENAINNQNPKEPTTTTTEQEIDPDTDIIQGLIACTDLRNLKNYYLNYKDKVKNKEKFIKLKDELKARMIR
jgi:hypothetical protein